MGTGNGARSHWPRFIVAEAAGMTGYSAVVAAVWLLRRFGESGESLGFLVQLALSMGIILAVVGGATLPAHVLDVEWPLAIGGALAAYITMLFLALATEFYVGFGNPYGLTVATGFGLFMFFVVAPRLKLSPIRMKILGCLVLLLSILAWFAPEPYLIAPALAWVGLPVYIAMWIEEP